MDQNNGRLEIITFGSFDILIDGDSLLTQFGKSQKALSLLKYFISNRGKKIPVNRIIEANFNSSEEMIKRINQRMNFLLNQV